MGLRTVNDIDRDQEARKHLWLGLKRLPPPRRIAFLHWACKQVRGPDRIAEVRVTKSEGHHGEVYWDLMSLAASHGLDLGRTCEKLERVLKNL